MGKYRDDVEQLLKLIGGKENIQAVSHCMTRMRFVLVDPKKADEKAIENIPKFHYRIPDEHELSMGWRDNE